MMQLLAGKGWPRLAGWLALVVGTSAVPGVGKAQTLAEHHRVSQAIGLLEVWLEAQQAYEQIPGLSAAAVHRGDILWTGAFGHADRERGVESTPATLYSICSISKLFTGIAVLQLRDGGRLRLDDPVAAHLPWFRIHQTADDSPEITVEGILTHSAGLPRESAHPYWTGPDFAFPTREEIIERVSGQETLYAAETYFQYSNLGLALAGEVVAAASDETFDAYVRRNILEPIGLDHTYTDMPAEEQGRGLAQGYSAITREGSREPVPFFQAHGIASAAGFASSAEDLARFAAWQLALLDGQDAGPAGSNAGNGSAAPDRGDDVVVLSRNTLRAMHRPRWVDPEFEVVRGLAFSVWRDKEKTFVGHGGSCPGFRSHLLLRPADEVATVFLANAQGVASQTYAQRMYDILAPAIVEASRDANGDRLARRPATPGGSASGSQAGSEPESPDIDLDWYAGSYASGFAGEIAVVPWKDGLAAVFLPTMDPLQGLTELRHVEGHTFRRVRSDGELGEPIVFVPNADGRPERFVWHDNQYTRLQ